jgi:hypothetical protein
VVRPIRNTFHTFDGFLVVQYGHIIRSFSS